MAQAGFTPIQLYYSTTASAVPTAGNLASGELAINISDGKLYYKNASNVVTLLATAGSVSSQWVTSGSNIYYNTGNVGVGTTSPAHIIHAAGNVNGNVTVASNNTSSGASAFSRFLALADAGNAQFGMTSSAYTDITGATDALLLNANNASGGMAFALDGTLRMKLDSSGNLGLGVTPSAWDLGKAIEVGTVGNSIWGVGSSNMVVGSNIYYASSSYKYANTAAASAYQQAGGVHYWYTAPSGTAGNAISFTQALTLDANRNLLLNGTSAGASSVGTFTIFNGTAPTGSVTDGVILFAADVSSSSELRVRDEAGNVTTLSPHNFSLIPEGPSEELAWAYYSEKGGKRINVDMLKLARMVEKLTGEKLVYES